MSGVVVTTRASQQAALAEARRRLEVMQEKWPNPYRRARIQKVRTRWTVTIVTEEP